MKKEIYDIGGMHCAACSASVERVTKKLPGVKESNVNLPMNILTIEYDEGKCATEDIIKKIEKAGFSATLHNDDKDNSINNKQSNSLINSKISIILSVCFAGLLLIFSMGQMIFSDFPIPDILSIKTHPYNFALFQILLCIPVYILERRIFFSGFKSLFHGSPNMDTLVAISSTASFIYSIVMTFSIYDNHHAVHNLYFESAAVVVALVSLGKYLEESSKEKTKSAISKLIKLAPNTAIISDSNGQWEVPISMIKVGDTVIVKPGCSVPVDGIVTDGKGNVNEAMLTGESLPVPKQIGSEVIAGSISVDGALYVKVTKIGKDTTLSKIIKFVEDAQGKKAPISRTADKVASVFVPIVIGISIISSAVWLISGADFSFALKIFTCILVIACPCAMGLATPTAIIVGTGIGAQHGILIRNGEALETTHKVSVVILDKTGTITEGNPTVTDVYTDNESLMLSSAMSLEMLSDHPISKAICKYASSKNINVKPVASFENIIGKGILGVNEFGNTIYAGNHAFLKEKGFDLSGYSKEFERLNNQGKTVIGITNNKNVIGLIAISDKIKKDTADAISKLKKNNIKTVMLTGDNKRAAEFIGESVMVDEIVAEVLPTQKAEIVKQYQDKGETVMMVGDGINDAPALTQADIGCAIGNGSDIAIESADVVLMKSELSDVSRAIKLSKMTIRNIRQNLFWAFCYNVIGIPIAAGVLYPVFGLLLSPMIGGLAMSLSSIFVVTNALRLKGKKI